MSMTIDTRLRRLEEKAVGPLIKVHACPDPHGRDPVSGSDWCAAEHCVCDQARAEHLAATRGRGTFIFISAADARL